MFSCHEYYSQANTIRNVFALFLAAKLESISSRPRPNLKICDGMCSSCGAGVSYRQSAIALGCLPVWQKRLSSYPKSTSGQLSLVAPGKMLTQASRENVSSVVNCFHYGHATK